MDVCEPTKVVETSQLDGNREQGAETPARRYLLKQVLAQGGLGEIWLAEDTELQREVALKVIQRRWLDRRGVEAQFRFEAIITGRLEHPGVVPVYDMGRLLNGQLFYCMKIIRGETFHSALRTFSTLPEGDDRDAARRRIYAAFVSLCQTIAFAHARGVIHLDLKPENVLLGAYGETQVLDWGLAKLLMGDLDPTCQRPVQGPAGTPGYMAPEQVDGEETDLGPRTDIFTLGVILAQVGLTELGRRLPKASFGDVDGFAGELRRSVRFLPGPLKDICLKAVSRQPADRYQDARELAAEVERYLGGDRVLAHREGPVVRFARLARKHRAKWLPIGIGLAIAMTAGSMWWTADRNRFLSALRFAEGRRSAAVAASAQGKKDRSLAALDDAANRLQPESAAHELLRSIDDERTQIRGVLAFEDALEKARYLSVDSKRKAEALEQCRIADQHREFSLPADYRGSRYEMDRTEMIAELEMLSRQLDGGGPSQAMESASRSSSSYALYLNGRQHELAGEWNKAREAYHAYLALRPGDFWATFFHAGCELHLNRPQEAVRDYTTCLDLKRDLPLKGSISFVYVNRGNAYLAMDATVLAIADYERASASAAETPALLHNHARALMDRGETETALEKLNQALSIAPDFKPSLQMRAQLHRAAGRRHDARIDLDRLLTVDPNSPPALVASAILACDDHDFAAALRDARAAERVDPTLSIASWVSGMMYAASDRPDDWLKSARAYEKALEAEPKNAQIRNNLGEVYIRLDRLDDARLHLDEAVRLKPTYALARFNRAIVLIGSDDGEKAIADLEAVPIAHPSHVALKRADRFAQTALYAGRVMDAPKAASVIDTCVKHIASVASRFDSTVTGQLLGSPAIRELAQYPGVARQIFGE